MVFSSITFLFYFLPALMIIYAVAPKKLKNAVMILGSFVFYSWGEIRFIPILVALSVIDYTCGRMSEKHPDRKKLFMLISVLTNLSVLVFFKYTNFFVNSFCSLFGLEDPGLNIMLPIGISFNSFQEMSYAIDVYKGRTKPEKSYYNYLTFTTLFPQIVAGPIVRYVTVGHDLGDHALNIDSLGKGMRRFIRGLAKKVLIANNVGAFWDKVSSGGAGESSVLLYWLGIIAFTLQIYFDFSGYSDMAIGLAKCFGFTFDENFDHPYVSKSVTEFWRRWHMTLGKWFRDYVYIPLGGNRVSKGRHIFNIFAVWALTGLWHGASWNFVIWGLYFALLLVFEKFFFHKVLEKLPAAFSHIYTMFLVVVSWVIFNFEDTSALFGYLKGMFGLSGDVFANGNALYQLFSVLPLMLIASFLCTPVLSRLVKKTEESGSLAVQIGTTLTYLAVFSVCIAYLVNSTYNPFLYFRF